MIDLFDSDFFNKHNAQMMSLSDFNDHVDKCTEAQLQYFAAKSASSASTSIRIKQKQDMKEKMISSVEDEEKKAREESLKILEEEGTVKDTFEAMLLEQF